MKPHIEIKSFLKLLIFLVVILALALSVFSVLQINSAKRQAISKSMETNLEKADIEMTMNLESINSNLEIAKSWGENGLLRIADVDAIQSQFLQLIRQYRNILAICMVSESGDATGLIKKESAVDMFQELDGKVHQWQVDVENKRKPVPLTYQVSDLRSAGWYQNAMAQDRAVFSHSHILNSNSTGSLAMPYVDKTTSKKGVVMFEIAMDEIASFDSKDYPQKKKHLFLFSPNGNIITLLNTLTLDEKTTEQQNQLINKIFVAAQSVEKNVTVSSSYQIDNKVWWTGILRSDKNSNILIGMITPESELVTEISSSRYKWLGVLSAAIGVGGLLFIVLIRKYRHTISQLDELHGREPDTEEERILQLIAGGESSTLEFKSTVRFNLKSGKNGREIEHAWLKNVAAFLNSQGGCVLIGVADDGEIAGLESDNFDNQDKCLLHVTNLVKQCIGTGFHQYLHINIHNVYGKDVVEIQVEPSKVPAYLLQNKEEEFFIRSGPSCSKLTTSQAVTYIMERQKQ